MPHSKFSVHAKPITCQVKKAIDANARLLFRIADNFALYCPEKNQNKIISIENNLEKVNDNVDVKNKPTIKY